MHSSGSSEKRDSEAQFAAAVKSYEAAVRYIQKQNYDKAKEILERLVSNAPAEVADRARVHLRLCEQKLHPPTKPLKSAEDFYVAGVSEMNARRLERSLEYLAKAEKLEPKREEIQYALAAAYAIQGDAEAALEHLRKSIELRPQNRFQARQDEDFDLLAADSRFLSLVNPERSMAVGAGS
ncbi:MAG TPA: tetratricopeptide repeat protein [Terriglobia bacterium]|nr:tetratricopeptide repeat protein [Terriglobia bacterium]